MKTFVLMAFTLFTSIAFGTVEYPVKNFNYISDWDYTDEVERSDKYVVMVFSSKDCLERTFVERTCWLFEKRFDYFVPKFSPLVKVVGFNTYFENYRVVNDLHINVNKLPTVLIMKSGKLIRIFEPTYTRPDWINGSWQDRLLKEVVESVQQIR